MGPSALNLFDMLANSAIKNRDNRDENDDDVNLPPDIKNALKKLDKKIE